MRDISDIIETMNDQVRADAGEIRDYEGKLHRLACDTEDDLERLRFALTSLGSSWNDRDFLDFESALVMSQKQARELTEEINRVSPKLKKMADHIDTAKRVRF